MESPGWAGAGDRLGAAWNGGIKGSIVFDVPAVCRVVGQWVCVRHCLVRAQSSRAADVIGLRALGGAGDGLIGAGGGCCVRESHGFVSLSRLGLDCPW